MYHATPYPEIILYESPKTGLFTPLLYGRAEPLHFCANRKAIYAWKCVQAYMVQEDLRTRRELAQRGWEIRPLPSPDLDSLYSEMPDELFEEYFGE